MGVTLQLTAADGHGLDAYRADPEGIHKGGIVVIQEIFGVNSHIRGLCDKFAAEGYTALAPALFDRVGKGIELGYEEADVAEGREIRGKITWEQAVSDVAAAVDVLKSEGRVAAVGYCWGGSVTWLAACRLDLACAVGYYGGQIADFKDEKPGCPVVLHFGETDASIPMDAVEAVKAAQPDVPVYVYPAGHGFACDQRGSFDAESTNEALPRTLALFAEHLG